MSEEESVQVDELDPVEEWEKLNRRINLAYYIGPKAVAAIGASINPEGVEVDIDGDGNPDITITKLPD